MTLYRVLGRRRVLDHAPGSEFHADLDPIQESRLIRGNHLAIVGESNAGDVDEPELEVDLQPVDDVEEIDATAAHAFVGEGRWCESCHLRYDDPVHVVTPAVDVDEETVG